MARRVKNTLLDTRTARLNLAPRHRPYWSATERGLHLGYRRPFQKVGGAWVVRFYLGNERYAEEGIGTADDYTDADGLVCLDYWQAQTKARQRWKERAAATAHAAPFTVGDAIALYFTKLEDNRKSVVDARRRLDTHVSQSFRKIEAAAVTAEMLRAWLRGMVSPSADSERVRKQRASANRVWTILRAALNHAFKEGKIADDSEWRRVTPFAGVVSSRVRYLTEAEAKRLLNACEPSFRNLVRAALETGARYSELGRLVVSDLNPDRGTLEVRESKSGKPRHIVLTDDGVSFFKQLCVGRVATELMLRRNDGFPWRASNQQHAMDQANRNAKIEPPVVFHELRHTWASLALMGGLPLLVVAKNLGHADTRMVEKHYGHLGQSYVTAEIRAKAPRFGLADSSNVKAMR